MNGLHLTADLHGCAAGALLADAAALAARCRAAVQAAGLTPVGELFHAFPTPVATAGNVPTPVATTGNLSTPGGVTGVVLLAESHLALHTWPELRAVTLDVYVCNVSGDRSTAAEALLAEMVSAFVPQTVQRQRLIRGALVTSVQA